MRVAVFSDVQGNLPAFEVVIDHILSWAPDLVVMAGDLVNRGPSSRSCVGRFDALRRDRGWLPIRGNHEEWVLRCGREGPTDVIDAEIRRFADWTYREIADIEEALRDWPDHLCFHGSGPHSWVHVTHGTMAGNRDGISPSIEDDGLVGKLPEDISLFVTAHTHKPLKRHFEGVDILNVGSVGSPFDGDVRASYGQLELRDGRWHTRILRLDYARDRAERDFHESGFISEGGALARIVFEEWRRARLLMPTWHRHYLSAVRAGHVSLDTAVDQFLASLD
jgi:predicted phosphodiesterase